MSLNVQFSDQVISFGTNDGLVTVLFATHAAEYRLSPERDNFVELMGKLAAGWKSSQPIKVEVKGVAIVAIFPAQ